jgi:hypothetical protein
VLLATVGQAATDTGPITYSDLLGQLPEDRRAKADALETFARSGGPGIADRLKAANALAGDEDLTGRERLQAQLLVAQLYGVMGSSKRTSAMKKAKRLATQLDDRDMVLTLAQAMDGDAALARLEKANAKALKAMAGGKKAKKGKKRKKPKASKKKKKKKGKGKSKGTKGGDAETIAASFDAWQTLEDKPRLLAARFALLAADAATASSKASRTKLRKALGELVSGVGEHRDLAPTVAAAHQLAAQLSLSGGAYKQAALHALAADRAARPPAKKAWPSNERNVVGRSKQTAALCAELKKKKLSCAQLEEDRWGDRTFWDFSKEKTRRFSQDKAREVLAEFDGLLKGCIDQSTQLTEFDTEVSFDWTVDGSGRVSKYTVRPRHLESGAFRTCTDAAFAAFRYPRFRGPAASVSYAIDIDLQDARLKP